MRSKLVIFILVAVVGALAACGRGNLVVLIPDPDGAVGGIRVANSAGSVEITAPNQATIVKDETTAPRAPADISPEEIQTHLLRGTCRPAIATGSLSFVL